MASATLDHTLRKRVQEAAGSTRSSSSRKTATATKTRKRKTGKRAPVSTLKAAETVLGRAKGPLHIKEITARILAMPDTGLKGKTPEASVGAILAVNSKKRDSAFKRTAPSTYTLKGKRA